MIKLRKPWLIRPAGTLAANVIRMLMSTVRQRIAVTGTAPLPPPPGAGPFLYVFWHEFSIFMTAFRVDVHVLASLHADGELMARICTNLQLKVIRGSTTRGGTRALLGLIRRSAGSHVAMTPDGPVGPRRRAKAGAIGLASMTGMPIIPIGLGSSEAWRAGSWDRMMIPRPWATAHYVAGSPIHVPAGLDRAGMNRYCRQVEESLEATTAAAERWAAGGPRPAPAPVLSDCA